MPLFQADSSFEVLQSFQDMERGSYEKVATNIDLLLEKQCPFGIRATITPQSVHHMKAMVKELDMRFPQLGGVVFDTVLSAAIFQTPAQLNEYYEDFSNEYLEAKEYGKQIGVKVLCTAMEPMSILRDRMCQGKVVLTPDGAISSCARVSSPKEEQYDQFVYGKIENGQVSFDKEKLHNMMSENNIYSQEQCKNCYARWNCGGGCRLFSLSFSSNYEEVSCRFAKINLKREIFETLSSNFQKTCQKNLWEHIQTEIELGHIN